MKGAQFTSTIDFVRAVHAEMAAITDAARHGGNARSSVESSDSPVTHSTTPFSYWQLRAWAAPTLPTL
jgi:hypothetical protein